MNDDDVMLTLQISSCAIVTNTSHLFAAKFHSFCPYQVFVSIQNQHCVEQSTEMTQIKEFTTNIVNSSLQTAGQAPVLHRIQRK
jgi:hypothetical protein